MNQADLENLVAQAIAIMSEEDIPDDMMIARIRKLMPRRVLAERLLIFIPEGFGLVMLGHQVLLLFPENFKVKDRFDNWVEFPLQAEPVLLIAMSMGMAAAHSEYANRVKAFERIALRSSSRAVIQKARTGVMGEKFMKMQSLPILGVAAEVYGEPEPAPSLH